MSDILSLGAEILWPYAEKAVGMIIHIVIHIHLNAYHARIGYGACHGHIGQVAGIGNDKLEDRIVRSAEFALLADRQ